MHRALLPCLALSLIASCDQPDAVDPPDDAAIEAHFDATVASLVDAATPNQQLDSSRAYDAATPLNPSDAAFDASSDSVSASGSFTSGETCYGSVDDYLTCDPQRCIYAQFKHVNDGTSPYELRSEGDCTPPPINPGSPGPIGYCLFIYSWSENTDVGLSVIFDPAIKTATTAAEATALLMRANLSIEHTNLSTTNVPVIEFVRNGNAVVTDDTRTQIASFDGRRLHIHLFGTVTNLQGGRGTEPYTCYTGDNPFPDVCYGPACNYADGAHGGSGTPSELEFDVTFDLP